MDPLFNSRITDPNISIKVLEFLDHHGLNNMRSVSKMCNRIINQTNLYQSLVPYGSFRDRYLKLIISQDELEGCLNKGKPGLSSFITSTSISILPMRWVESFLPFSWIKEELDYQRSSYKEMAKLHSECEKLKLECKAYESSEKMVDLFGGKKAWEDLPTLDPIAIYLISHSQPGTLSMTAPMMRGIDESGYNFFALRLKRKLDGLIGCLALIYLPYDAEWRARGFGFEFFNPLSRTKEDPKIGYYIMKFNPLDPEAFSVVKNLIENGTKNISIV